MNANTHLLELQPAPHLHHKISVSGIMYQVIFALLPVCAFSVWTYGLSALALIATCTAACLAAELILNFAARKASTLSDGSAAITGLLLALTLPPGFPLWMAALGALISIALGKALFGGLGANIFNPALVGRAVLQASFPLAMTTWSPAMLPDRFTAFVPSTLTPPFCKPPVLDAWLQALAVDGFSGATPLSLQKFDHLNTGLCQMVLGHNAGSVGESAGLLVILAGLYLVARKIVNWRVPVAVLGSALVVSGIFYVSGAACGSCPVFTLFSGGLLLGAFFMATDPAGSPVTPRGLWIFGAFIGALTVLIRVKGGLPEGVMYAILLGNALTPLIDRWTQPRVLGQRKVHHE
jgi:electron transport complex protein RnfD